jgi:hypothetical protein
MDRTLILQLITERRVKIADTKSVREYDNQLCVSELFEGRNMQYLLVIAPFHISEAFVLNTISMVFSKTALEGVVFLLPSFLSTFTFKCRDIFYIDVNLDEKDDIQNEEIADEIKDTVSPIETEENKKKKK